MSFLSIESLQLPPEDKPKAKSEALKLEEDINSKEEIEVKEKSSKRQEEISTNVYENKVERCSLSNFPRIQCIDNELEENNKDDASISCFSSIESLQLPPERVTKPKGKLSKQEKGIDINEYENGIERCLPFDHTYKFKDNDELNDGNKDDASLSCFSSIESLQLSPKRETKPKDKSSKQEEDIGTIKCENGIECCSPLKETYEFADNKSKDSSKVIVENKIDRDDTSLRKTIKQETRCKLFTTWIQKKLGI